MTQAYFEKWLSLDRILTDTQSLDLHSGNLDLPKLYEMLDLNASQLTQYLEEEILDNPFIEIEYALEKNMATISNHQMRQQSAQGDQMLGTAQSLLMFLFEQILMYRQTPIRDAMVQIVDYIDDRGYLPYTYQELASKLQLDPMVCLDAMTLIKQLEPAGVGAYDLKECLMLQTEQDPQAPNTAYLLLESHFDLISDQDFDGLVAASSCSPREVTESLQYYHALRAHPADLFDSERINRMPDLSLRINAGLVEMRYNRQYYPRLVFSQAYYEEMAQQNDPDLLAYIEPHRQAFGHLVNLLRMREKIILRVGAGLVQAQLAYLLEGKGHKRPYLVKDLAKDTGLSEAVVQMISSRKSLETENGILALVDLISVSQHQGRGGFNTSQVKATILEILAREGQDVSNRTIVDQLAQEKIMMSEQLVADYRKALVQD